MFHTSSLTTRLTCLITERNFLYNTFILLQSCPNHVPIMFQSCELERREGILRALPRALTLLPSHTSSSRSRTLLNALRVKALPWLLLEPSSISSKSLTHQQFMHWPIKLNSVIIEIRQAFSNRPAYRASMIAHSAIAGPSVQSLSNAKSP